MTKNQNLNYFFCEKTPVETSEVITNSWKILVFVNQSFVAPSLTLIGPNMTLINDTRYQIDI